MSDTIFVTGLLIHAHHGVMEHEAKVGQRFVLDLELTLDLTAGSRSDRLADTVSYFAIPTRWEIRAEPLPTLAGEKVDKRALASRFTAPPKTNTTTAP